MAKNPLAEVFGYPVDNMTRPAVNHRRGRLCPYHNSSGINCTKSSATDPIGVCSIFEGNRVVVTCPVRFREDFKIISEAADFFFPNYQYVALTEARLKDKHGKSAGNIDIVIAALDDRGRVTDFGAVEVQAVYITGNVKNVFKKYMMNPAANSAIDWPRKNYPGPDYLSSSRKRLAPQYTRFESALATLTTPSIGEVHDFVAYLQSRINKGKIMGIPAAMRLSPDVEPLPNLFEGNL